MNSVPRKPYERYDILRNAITKTHIPLLMQVQRSKEFVSASGANSAERKAEKAKLEKQFKPLELKLANRFLGRMAIVLKPRAANYPEEQTKSGDYPLVYLKKNGRVTLGFGDTIGKGTEGAELRDEIGHKIHELRNEPYAQTVLGVDGFLKKRNEELLKKQEFAAFTSILGEYNPRTRVFSHVNAAQGNLFVVRNGTLIEVHPDPKTSNSWLGDLGENEKLVHTKLKLQPGDRLFFLSDGVTEHRKPVPGEERSEIIDEQKIHDALTRHSNLPLEEHVNKILQTLDEFYEKRHDDQTIMALELRKKPKFKTKVSSRRF
ncbi:MAG: SpoIIE family protein phosphatase [Candidatus Micrarchaeota archaeon]